MPGLNLMDPVLRLLAVAAALAVSGLVVTACGSPAGEAAGPTSTPTPTPTAMGEQVSAEPTHTPTSTPTAMGEQAAADPTHTPTSTPTPTASGEQDSNSDPEATSTPTPTPASSEPVSDPDPPATTTLAVTTTEVVAAGPPLGDCFGGVLSEDPLHCYVLEQAQAEGLIDIVGIYKAGRVMYVLVSQAKLSAELFTFTKEKANALYNAWPWLVPNVCSPPRSAAIWTRWAASTRMVTTVFCRRLATMRGWRW